MEIRGKYGHLVIPTNLIITGSQSRLGIWIAQLPKDYNLANIGNPISQSKMHFSLEGKYGIPIYYIYNAGSYDNLPSETIINQLVVGTARLECKKAAAGNIERERYRLTIARGGNTKIGDSGGGRFYWLSNELYFVGVHFANDDAQRLTFAPVMSDNGMADCSS